MDAQTLDKLVWMATNYPMPLALLAALWLLWQQNKMLQKMIDRLEDKLLEPPAKQ